MNAGLLSLKPTEGDPAALKEGTGETPSATTQLQAVFGAEEWSFVGVFLNVDGGGAATAILDITDGSTAYFRLAVSDANLLTIEHTGNYGLEDQVDHVSDAYDLADGDAVYVFVTVRDGQIMGYINGALVLDEAYSGFTISPVLFLMGGNLASMSLDVPCTVDVGLFAFYSCALTEVDKQRYDGLVATLYPDIELS